MEDICIKAINTYGDSHQLGIAMEELAELIQACNKYRRALDGSFSLEKAKQMLIEEIADVEICLTQIRHIASIKNDTVEAMKAIKLNRLSNSMNVNLSKQLTIEERLELRQELLGISRRI